VCSHKSESIHQRIPSEFAIGCIISIRTYITFANQQVNMTGTTSLLQVAEQAGMKPEDAKKASGGILELLKNNLKKEDFDKLLQKVPDASKLLEDHEDMKTKAEGSETTTGGSSDLMGMASSFLGGGGGGGEGGGKVADSTTTTSTPAAGTGEGAASSSSSTQQQIASVTALMAFLGKQGISPQQVLAFIPKASAFFKAQGIDVGQVLGEQAAATSAGSANYAAGGITKDSSTDNVASGGLAASLGGFASSFFGGGKKK
jgi:hypothetical protein